MKTDDRAERMAEYLIKQLERGGHKGSDAFRYEKSTASKRKEALGKEITDNDIHYVFNGKDIILLVPGKVTNSKKTTPPFKFNKTYNLARNSAKENFLSVFYKDNNQFFRCPFDEDLSLKKTNEYKWLSREDKDNKSNIILLSPEELVDAKQPMGRNTITYFQPESDRLEQMIRTFAYAPVQFDYTNHKGMQNMGIAASTSERLYRWRRDEEKPGALRVHNNKLYTLEEKL